MAASFGAAGAASAAIADQTPIDPRDIPELPGHLKKKMRLAWLFIQAAKRSGDPHKRRNAMNSTRT